MVVQFDRGDLRRLSEGFATLIDGAESIISAHNASPPFEAGSEAEREASESAFTSHVVDVVSYSGLRIAVAMDHCVALTEFGRSAAAGLPTAIYPVAAVARSVVEVAAQACWLLQPSIGSSERARRILSVAWQEVRSQRRLIPGILDEAQQELSDDSRTLGVSIVGEGGRQGVGASYPTFSSLVESLFPEDPGLYSILSAVTHGESWATRQIGYREASEEESSGSSWGTVMQKDPPINGMVLFLNSSMRAAARSVWLQASFRGWRLDEVRTLLERSYRHAGLAHHTMFWRP